MNRIFTITCLLLFIAITSAAEDTTGWTISAKDRNDYHGQCLCNGNISVIPSEKIFGINDIIIAGVYDKGEKYDNVSTTSYAPNFMNLSLYFGNKKINENDIIAWEQHLDLHHAKLTTKITTAQAEISYSLYALRNMPYMSIMDVEITPLSNKRITVVDNIGFHKTHSNSNRHINKIRFKGEKLSLYNSTCTLPYSHHDIGTSTSFIFDDTKMYSSVHDTIISNNKSICFNADLEKNKKLHFSIAGAVCTSPQFDNPANEAQRMVLFAAGNGVGKLTREHDRMWNEIWKSDIIIEGDKVAQQDVRLALFNLYSSISEGTRMSIPPFGWTSNKYNSHIFWDMELWMFPPLLMLNNSMARSAIDYRTDHLCKAMERARMFGYKGAMFPWENDDHGESTPLWALTGPLEHHITADIAIAFWNYYCVTKDTEWLRKEGYPLIKQVADFWVSRSQENDDHSYSINNVVCADEYAINVNDNAFTNAAAKIALNNAIKAAGIVGEAKNEQWKKVADNLKFISLPDGVISEYDGYNGEKVKQADVNLLAYPLNLMTEKSQVLKNLKYYEPRIDPNGPAMGNSILAILYAQLGDGENAYRLFRKCYEPNKCKPFGTLSECAGDGKPYFCTGAGGMLQVILSGFGGLRITDNGIEQIKPILPKHWKRIIIKGVGKDRLDFVVNPK